jgi:cytochrome P450
VHRDARHFAPDPQAFWPERWTAAGPKLAEARGVEFRLNKAAWMPFSYGARWALSDARAGVDAVAGPWNCIGRALAMGEMRAVLAALVRRFDMRLAPAFDRAVWERELEDRFVLSRGALPVIMSKRA